MGLEFVEGFSTTLTADLLETSVQMSLASVEGLEAITNGVYTYLAISDGVSFESVRVIRISESVAVIERTAPKTFYIGACVSFKITKAVLEDTVCSTDCGVVPAPNASSTTVYKAGSGIGITGGAEEPTIYLDACSLNNLNDAASSKAIICHGGTNYLVTMETLASALQDHLQLGSNATNVAGVESVSTGAGIQLSGTPVRPLVALEAIHNGLVAGSLQVDAYGRVVEVNNRTAEEVEDGLFTYATVKIVNGQMVLVESGEPPLTQLVGEQIRVTEARPGVNNIALMPGPLAEVIDGDWTFDKYGFLTGYPDYVGGSAGDGGDGGSTDPIFSQAAIIGRGKIIIPSDGLSVQIVENSNLVFNVVGGNVRCVLNALPESANYSVLVWADFITSSRPTTYSGGGDVQLRGRMVMGSVAYTNSQSIGQFTFAVNQTTGSPIQDTDTYQWLYAGSTVNVIAFS